jgi:hypothetical protein
MMHEPEVAWLALEQENAAAFPILRRFSRNERHTASWQDFQLGRPEAEDFIRRWRDDPHTLTPYCLDRRSRSLLFVETAPGVDLCTVHPFFYQAQRLCAIRLHSVPMPVVLAMARDLPATLDKLTLIHSTGRYGSTLLTRLLQAHGDLVTICEPDLYTQLVHIPPQDAQDLMPVIRAATLFLGTSLARESHLVLKMRGVVTYRAAMLAEALPGSRSIFLYRHAVDVVNSFLTTMVPPRLFRLARALGVEHLPTRWLLPSKHAERLAPLLTDRSYRPTGLVGFFAMAWLSKMDAALAFQEHGGLAATLRYEALRRNPGYMLERLATALGLEGDFQPAALERALGKDVQQGSSMASRQLRVLDQHDERRLRRLLAHHPRLNQPDVVLPGSLEP